MMPSLPFQWHLLVLLINLGGLTCLALSSEREGELLLKRAPGKRLRWVLRGGGWAWLAWALAVCMLKWRYNFGLVLWLGWLTVAATALVFSVAYWPWRKRGARVLHGKPEPAVQASPEGITSLDLKRAWHLTLCLSMVGLPLLFAWLLYTRILTP
ncbi:DUF3325 domain-containing protein [Ottowia thiooxydans]|uniref:DUF3325 domain-containing protein n=1 Tax=Ottowia thiooxydans TaxID=219182 RepID=UPI0004097B1C|nr:DUF3325 domain-containing protein [Ottowia thiooxydans]